MLAILAVIFAMFILDRVDQELPSLKHLELKFGLRWLDTVFQGQYLPSLSINYVAINKVL